MSVLLAGNDTQSPLEAVQHFVLQYASLCVISMGKQGCMARSRSGEAVKAPACGVAVVDTIGAGDCFTAGFLYAYLQVRYLLITDVFIAICITITLLIISLSVCKFYCFQSCHLPAMSCCCRLFVVPDACLLNYRSTELHLVLPHNAAGTNN